MTELLSWIGSEEAGNWIALATAFGTVFTALATGYTAKVIWQERKPKVRSEWRVSENPKTSYAFFLIHLYIHNDQDGLIFGEYAEIKGPVANIAIRTKSSPTTYQNVRSGRKYAQTAPRKVGINFLSLDPKSTEQLDLVVELDPEEIKKVVNSMWPRVRNWWSHRALDWFDWRVSSGVEFSISLIVRRRSSPRRPIRITQKVSIPADMAMKIVDNMASDDVTITRLDIRQ
jgi:hypothetical protein